MSKRSELRAGAVRDRHGNRDEEPADDRRRDVQAREHRNRAPQTVAGEENNPSYRDGVDEIEGKHLDQSGRPRKPPTPKGWRLSHHLGRPTWAGRRRPSRAGLEEERPGRELPWSQPGGAGQRQLGRREIDRKPPFVGAPTGALDRRLPVSPPRQAPAARLAQSPEPVSPARAPRGARSAVLARPSGASSFAAVGRKDGGAAPAQTAAGCERCGLRGAAMFACITRPASWN